MMRNGYFKLVNIQGGFGLKLIPPKDGGQDIVLSEVVDHLDYCHVVYDFSTLKKNIESKREMIMTLGAGECPKVNENYVITISPDKMEAVARFTAPSDTGDNLTMDEFIKDLKFRKVITGIQMEVLQDFFMNRRYCENIVVAQGKPAGEGRDASIEYFFNTDQHAQPTLLEDGSVDFFNLNAICHCKKGDLLAQITPEEKGETGVNICGEYINSRDVKGMKHRFGHNMSLSEDGLCLYSNVDGHVTLVDDQVFVSDLYLVENVDNSTGNIVFEGSVQINGNVKSNFSVSAKGNVVVNGVVEGAYIKADGNIIIARGMNGMGKGKLEAGGNIIAKFLESVTAEADGYIHAESVLHSQLQAGTEIEVDGKRGFITGGKVSAANKITVKNLGSEMGASTIVEVGSNPKLKEEFTELSKELVEIQKIIKSSQPIIASFAEKKAKGAKFSDDQLIYIKKLAFMVDLKKKELAEKYDLYEKMQEQLNSQSHAKVVVKGSVHPGTKIVIGDLSMVVQSTNHFCRFEKVQGNVKMTGM